MSALRKLYSRSNPKTLSPFATALITAALLGTVAGANAQSVGQASDDVPLSVNIGRDVTVEDGDTLRSIALRELGRQTYASALATFNGVEIDAILVPGSTLRIPINVPNRGEVASVIFFKGAVSLNGDPMEDTATLVVGDTFSTGADGFISLEFSNGSVVNLQPESAAILQRLNCLEQDDSCVIEIETTDGSLMTDVEPRDGQPLEFRITTPYASAAVRGTVFDVQADPESLLVAVTEGTVAIAALGATVPVNEGFGSVTVAGEAPGQPVELLPAPAYRKIPGRVAIGDSVLWWALSEVDEYSATLTLDSDGVETIADTMASGDRLEVAALDGVTSGEYYLSLRGIDENGLPGFISSTRLVVADIAPNLAAPVTTVTREGNDTLVSVVDPAADASGFEIQISTSDDFSDALAVDVGPTGSAVFRLSDEPVFARARQLVDPTTVSAFGPIAQEQ